MTHNIAHRGMKNRENTLEGIIKANTMMSMVEIDVRFNTNHDIILCHDREDRNFEINETLEELLLYEDTSLNLMIDIKAFGIEPALKIAKDVFTLIVKYPKHNYHLCSFNEFCVEKLLNLRIVYQKVYQVGVISSGIPLDMFDHLCNIDFISLDYNIICEDIVEMFHKKNIKVFAWTVNSLEMQKYVLDICHVDSIIYDIFD
jgi:glycerophosphoryl diester phosphodiesterase